MAEQTNILAWVLVVLALAVVLIVFAISIRFVNQIMNRRRRKTAGPETRRTSGTETHEQGD